MRRLVCGALLLVAGVTQVACGDLGAGEETDRVDQLQLVRKQDIARYPVGSPERTFLEWWRALQFRSGAGAAPHYAASLDLTPRELQRQLDGDVGVLGLDARPRVVDVIRADDRATLLALFTAAARNPNGRADKTRQPRSFQMVRESGGWKLADNRYVTRSLQAARIFLEGGKERQRPERDPGG